MTYLVDSNILINAARASSKQHLLCRDWLISTAEAGHSIALTEIVELSFLRVMTHPKLDPAPLSQVLKFWSKGLWSFPQMIRLHAGVHHTEILEQLLITLKLTGNDINDAWLAALAIENHATLVSLDQGFARFKILKWLDLNHE